MHNLKFPFKAIGILTTFCVQITFLIGSSNPDLQEKLTSPPITIVVRGTSRLTNATRLLPFLPSIIPDRFKTPEEFLPITALRKTSRFYELAHALSLADPENFPFEHCFFFGWSGKISRRARIAAAQQLCSCIKKLKQNPLYTNSPVRVITHSHGGNLALSLALHCNDEDLHLIDQLILLACPVQDATEKFLSSHAFKEIISIYTTGDLIQIIDPQGLYNREAQTMFSRRTFKPTQNTVKQICVTYRKKSLGHMTFVEPWFSQLIPQLISKASLTSSHIDIYPSAKNSTAKKSKRRAKKALTQDSHVLTINLKN